LYNYISYLKSLKEKKKVDFLSKKNRSPSNFKITLLVSLDIFSNNFLLSTATNFILI